MVVIDVVIVVVGGSGNGGEGRSVGVLELW